MTWRPGVDGHLGGWQFVNSKMAIDLKGANLFQTNLFVNSVSKPFFWVSILVFREGHVFSKTWCALVGKTLIEHVGAILRYFSKHALGRILRFMLQCWWFLFFGMRKGERNLPNSTLHHMEPWFSTGIRTCGQGFEGLPGRVFHQKRR